MFRFLKTNQNVIGFLNQQIKSLQKSEINQPQNCDPCNNSKKKVLIILEPETTDLQTRYI